MAAIYHDEKGEIGGGIAGVSVAEESGIWIGKKKKKNKKSLENYGGEKKKMRKRDSIILSIGPSGNAIFDVCFAMNKIILRVFLTIF